jgi:hypothetical protein
MANRAQIDRIAQRIEALARPNHSGPHIGVVFQGAGQTVEEAREAHATRYPEDDVEKMMVIGWQPMTTAQWIAKYSASTVEG